jgi:alpha-L-fucosidase 2
VNLNRSTLVVVFLLAVLTSGGSRTEPRPAASRVPAPQLNLVLTAPIETWDEAIPLGNGLLGGLLWGKDNLLRLSLDRGDLWDERPATGLRTGDFNYATARQLVAAGQNDEFNRIFDGAYDDRHPTKLPAGRLEITLDPGARLASFELNLATAEGRAHLASSGRIDAFFSAVEPVALIRIPATGSVGLRLFRPQSLDRLEYASPETGENDGARWFVQRTTGVERFCVYADSRRVAGATLVALSVTSSRDGADPLGLARQRTASALVRGYEALLEPHARWWQRFWSASRVEVPDVAALRHYYLTQYFYGAASRAGAPPMPLQGVWTADAAS